jgi:branched-chain amino acid transport system permease protein
MAGFAGALWAHFITSFSPYAFYLSAMFVFLAMLVIGGPNGVSGAVVGAVLVTVLREVLRSVENNVNTSKIFSQILPSGLVGFTEVVMAVLLIVILILRPGGIMGGREIAWPLWQPRKASGNGPESGSAGRQSRIRSPDHGGERAGDV